MARLRIVSASGVSDMRIIASAAWAVPPGSRLRAQSHWCSVSTLT